jgi:hypothetical protein
MTLAEQQAALLAALSGTAPAPAGFDPARVHAAASALALKRACAVAHAWPSVCRMLGAEYRAQFAAYAAHAPLPRFGGPLADGRFFVQYLSTHIALSDATKLQALTVDARYRLSPIGLAPRRLPALRVGWLAQSRALAVVFGKHIHRFVLTARQGNSTCTRNSI